MKILKLSKQNQRLIITQAVSVLKAGGLVIFPTETVYGAGVNATDPRAVSKLLIYKKRPAGKAVSIAVSDKTMAEKYVEINKDAERIYNNFLPGPVTVISNSRHKTDRRLEAENGTLGIRIPQHKLLLQIIRKLGFPVTATSANSAGKKTPYSITDIFNNLSAKQKQLIDLVIDAGKLPPNEPSTVLDTTRSNMQILRQGKLGLDKLLKETKVTSDTMMLAEGAKFARQIKSHLTNKCVVVLLNGEIGSGKTHFVKGLARELGVEQNVNSPTFSLMKEYHLKSGGMLIHADAWRLENEEELAELKLEQYFKPKNLIALEWAGGGNEFFRKFIHKPQIQFFEISFSYLSEKTRSILIKTENE